MLLNYIQKVPLTFVKYALAKESILHSCFYAFSAQVNSHNGGCGHPPICLHVSALKLWKRLIKTKFGSGQLTLKVAQVLIWFLSIQYEARTAQSVKRLSTGWTTEFYSWQGQELFFATMSKSALGPIQPPIQLGPQIKFA
jgi:hypothetical protein